jgi:hypothetical protein
MVEPTFGNKTSARASDEEESIEDYMAKLLQRVRGDAPAAPASQSAPAVVRPTAPRMPERPAYVQHTAAPVSTESLDAPPSANISPASPDVLSREEFKRVASAPERAANFQALRDLANQSTRRALAVHATQTYRRSAVTKVIVSVLAAMTSFWFMLLAPGWHDPQFISGGVLLLVAAYWVGQTVQALLESIRLGDSVHSDEDQNDDADVLGSGLPIDIEQDDRW